MTLTKYNKKIEAWWKQFPKATSAALKEILKAMQREAKAAYSGGVVGIKTQKTRNAIKYKLNRKGMVARVFVAEPRGFIARFHEDGTSKMKRSVVFEPMKEKYKPKVANQILKSIMRSYKSGK